MPAGLWSSEISFYGEDDRPVPHRPEELAGQRLQRQPPARAAELGGLTSVTYCQPEYDRRSVWYLETTDPAFTARGIRVGSTRAEVENAYPTPRIPLQRPGVSRRLVRSSQEGRLKPAILFFFEDGLVSRIAVDFRTH